MAKGKILYVPPSLVSEMESIKIDLGLDKNVEALHKMTKYSQIGREAEYIHDLKFLRVKRRRP
jgi:hypothetical protein